MIRSACSPSSRKTARLRFVFPGEVFGAITTKEEFGNCHIRVEYKWGEKKWPPREQPKHYRDTGILYWCIGEHGAGSGAWMRSVECNIMERGVGQWWPVAGTYVDIEGRKVVLEKEPSGAVSRRESGRDMHSLATRRAAVHHGRGDHFAARSGESRRVERVRSDCVGQRRHSPAQWRGRARGHESAFQRRRARVGADARQNSTSVRRRRSFFPQSRGARHR